MRTIAFAIAALLIAAPAAAQTPYPPMPCSYYAQSAYGYAIERNRGFTKESRLEELERPPANNRTAIATDRAIILDLWAHPEVTPEQAFEWARGWCGWRPLKG